MIGSGVLIECLADARVDAVLAIGRNPCGRVHTKLRELVRADLFHYDDLFAELASYDVCLFCLGASSAGMSEAAYRRITFDLTLAAAAALVEANPKAVFCYVSGAGTDSTEQGRFMWARVKGATENELLRRCNAYLFRPGFIQPVDGVRSKTGWYRLIYDVVGPLYPVLSRLAPNTVTTTKRFGRAMLEVAANGYPKRVLETAEINALAPT